MLLGEHDQIGVKIFQVFEGHAEGPVAIGALLAIISILSFAYIVRNRRAK
jgi:hypothetical protein